MIVKSIAIGLIIIHEAPLETKQGIKNGLRLIIESRKTFSHSLFPETLFCPWSTENLYELLANPYFKN
jgi:hypothetical protein